MEPLSPEGVRRAALVTAREHLEEALQRSPSWRALIQLDERERNGDWLDVIEADVLRKSLIDELAHDEAYLAWRHISTALGENGIEPVVAAARCVGELVEPAMSREVPTDRPSTEEVMLPTWRPSAVADRLPTLAPSAANVKTGRPAPHAEVIADAEVRDAHEGTVADEGDEATWGDRGSEAAHVVIRRRESAHDATAAASASIMQAVNFPARQAAETVARSRDVSPVDDGEGEAVVIVRRGTRDNDPRQTARRDGRSGYRHLSTRDGSPTDDESAALPAADAEASVTIVSLQPAERGVRRTAPHPAPRSFDDTHDDTPRLRFLTAARRIGRRLKSR